MALDRLALSRATLDRAAHRRSRPGLVQELLTTPGTRVLPVRSGQAPVRSLAAERPDGVRLHTIDAADWAGPQPLAFMGEDDAGVAYLVGPLPDDDPLQIPAATWVGLREAGAILDDTGAGLLTGAVALIAWHAAHPRCARCGHLTDVALAGWERHCPNCDATHYPRTDPAVIMAIVDGQDRLLLGRQKVWPERRYSVLAGFVEPGESLEAAVRREVLEESGIVVGEVSYWGSQPWPFPSSLMVGFSGRAAGAAGSVGEQPQPDGDELAEAAWWSRDALLAAVADGSLVLPGPVSIARRLIEQWFGSPIDDGVHSWR